MKVQRVRLPNTNQIRWIVLDDAFVPIQPIRRPFQIGDKLVAWFAPDLEWSPYGGVLTAASQYERN